MKRETSGHETWANNRIRLVITNRCDINCFYCHNEGHAKGDGFLSRETFNQLIMAIKHSETTPHSVSIVGGEPLIHPDLSWFIAELKPFVGSVSVTSNGISFTVTKLKELAKAGCDRVRLGVDSIRQRRSRPSHGLSNPKPITDVITDIRDAGLKLELNVVLTNFNRHEVPELVSLAANTQLDIKFFEHIKVGEYAKVHGAAQIKPAPFMPFDEFDRNVRTSVHIDSAVPDLGGANHVYLSGPIEVRYCRYLHPYKMCDQSGTRIGPNGYVTVCMEEQETVFLTAGDSPEESLQKIRSVYRHGCGQHN